MVMVCGVWCVIRGCGQRGKGNRGRGARRGGGQGGGRPTIGGGGAAAAAATAGRVRVGEEKHVDGGRGGEEGDSNFKF